MIGRPSRALGSFVAFGLCLGACAPAAHPTAPAIAPAVSVAASAPASAAAAPAAPSYRAIHLDTVLPAERARFEAARKDWVTELRRVGASDWRGLFLEVGADRFYSMRPLARFGSLDPEPAVPGAPPEPEPSEAAEKRYDEESDAVLAYPHTSEIWRADDALGYAPAPPAAGLTEQTANCGTFVIEDVRADAASVHRYRSAEREIVAALKQVRYPLTRIAYRTAYGAGHQYTLLLAPTPEALAAAPTVEDALVQAKGAAKAREILADIEAEVLRREALPLRVRHDLTVP